MSTAGLEVEIQGRFRALSMDLALHATDAPIVVAGPNGAGKTTLLMAILGAETPARGHVTLDGVPLFDRARDVDVPVERRRIGYLPQRYTLFPHLAVLDNVAYGVPAVHRPERRRRAAETLAALGLASLAARRPAELSGGEAQRVALARALVREPQLMLLDEPFGALDALTRTRMHALLQALCARHNPAVLLVTHDVDEAILLADRVLVLVDGAISMDQPVGLARPRDRGHAQFSELRVRLLAELGVSESVAPSSER